MNIARTFVDLLETLTGSIFGQDLFIGDAPSSNKVQNAIWWVVVRGGTVLSTNPTSERTKEILIEVYYRDRDSEKIHNTMQTLEEQLNCANCVTLDGYDVLDVTCEPLFVDNDIDNEDRKVGLLQVNLTIYQEC